MSTAASDARTPAALKSAASRRLCVEELAAARDATLLRCRASTAGDGAKKGQSHMVRCFCDGGGPLQSQAPLVTVGISSVVNLANFSVMRKQPQ